MIGVVAASASFYVHAQSAASAPLSASVPRFASASASASASATNGGKATRAADRALRRRILTALGKEKNMRASGITVRATNGDVLLEGWVPEQAQIDQATRVAQNVQGVKSVRNMLTLSTF
ncbi:transport-associated protein [Caballeronia glebae]|uniref:Transport-associated protein n=2 Tax=Caballeronia glebae TaxID=1777143 RepID=A0A158C3C2_9BURK|nr:transport-associated protein [Caballeronia glebae]